MTICEFSLAHVDMTEVAAVAEYSPKRDWAVRKCKVALGEIDRYFGRTNYSRTPELEAFISEHDS